MRELCARPSLRTKASDQPTVEEKGRPARIAAREGVPPYVPLSSSRSCCDPSGFALTGHCTRKSSTAHESRLRRAAPSLRLNLPDAIAVRERVRKGTGPNDGLALDRDSESP